MSKFFTDYHEAYEAARQKADRLGLPVAIRGGKEWGKRGYHVRLLCNMDSDGMMAEIVKPGSPRVGRPGAK